jgi:DNA-binding transcriptional ArsR family regulator
MKSRARTAGGDADLASVAALIAEPARARMLLALSDGRALPATTLAAEAGVAASTASSHLSQLLDGGLLAVTPNGRHRYYRLAGPHVGRFIETLAGLAPNQQVRSLRDGTRAQALRAGRTCYDHLAGRLGVDLFAGLLARGYVVGGDGRHHEAQATTDRFAAPGHDIDYRLTLTGRDHLAALGVHLPAPGPDGFNRLRYCVDWTEQRHHVAGAVGRAITDHLFADGWLIRTPAPRTVRLTDLGRVELARHFGVVPD